MRIVLLHSRICSLQERSDQLCIMSVEYFRSIEALVDCEGNQYLAASLAGEE